MNETRIGRTMFVRGDVESSGDLRVLGRLHGDVRAAGRVTIERRAELHGSIEARRVDVTGLVQGPVRATERIEVKTDATVLGDLFAPRILIADGARFEGTVHMERRGSDEDQDADR